MFRKLVIIFGLCCLMSCGSYVPPVINTPPAVITTTNPVPPPPMPPIPPTGNMAIVQRGFYAGCRGNVVYVFYRFGFGNYYTINPLYCPLTDITFYNVTLHWSFF